MRFFVLVIVGVSIGFPIGVFFGWLLRRSLKEQMCGMPDRYSDGTLRGQYCIANPATTCLDRLCAAHCAELHGNSCRTNFLISTGTSPENVVPFSKERSK